MTKWIKSMRKKHPHWTYVYIPQAHDDLTLTLILTLTPTPTLTLTLTLALALAQP